MSSEPETAEDAPAVDQPGDGDGAVEANPLDGDAAADSTTDPTAADLTAASAPATEMTVEDLVNLVEQLTAERDGHFEARARLQAEFDNYRKRQANQQQEFAERANEGLVSKLLPVLDACDAALAHNAEGVAPIAGQLAGVLEKEGLARLADAEVPFDPAVHEAVIHTDGDGPTTVVEVLRTGYLWKGRVVRPAMVKVQG